MSKAEMLKSEGAVLISVFSFQLFPHGVEGQSYAEATASVIEKTHIPRWTTFCQEARIWPVL
jgi:hypothetical protein